MRTADNLKLVKLQPEHASGVFDQRTNAKGATGWPQIESGLEVPDFDFAIIGTRNDAFGIEPDTSDEFLMAFEDTETSAVFNVPKANGVVGATRDHQMILIL